MAVISVTSNTNFDDASVRAMVNGDTITITNGARLTINSDPQTGINGAYLSGITVTAGEVFVNGTTVRMVNYTTASVLPVLGDICTCTATGASGEVIAVTGTTASGTLKLRSITGGTGVFTATALTFTGGKTATATAADTVGWLLVCGMETASITLPSRLSSFRAKGAWYVLGTSNGAANQTFNHYTTDILPAVWVETGAGTNVYEIWLNAGSRWVAGLSNGERGKYFLMNNGTATVSFATGTILSSIPPTGARIRVPNVHFASVAAAATNATTRTINAALASRYKTTTTGPGMVSLDTVAGAGFYVNTAGAYSLDIINSGLLHAVSVAGTIYTTTIDGLGIGQTTTTNYTPITVMNCLNNTTRVVNSAVTNYLALTTGAVVVTNCQSVTMSVAVYTFARAVVAVDAIRITTSFKVTLTGCAVAGARLHIISSDDVTITNLRVSDMAQGANVTTLPLSSIVVEQGCDDVTIDGLVLMTGGTQPYTSWINASACMSMKVRNIGTAAAPLASATQTGYFMELAGVVLDSQLARLYVTGLRTGNILGTPPNSAITMLNVDLDSPSAFQQLSNDSVVQGCRLANPLVAATNPTLTTTGSLVGSHFYDLFNTDTTGVVGILFHEDSTTAVSVASYTITAGTPFFNGMGGLLLRTMGDQIEYTWAYSILGHTGFVNSAPTLMGTVTNLSYEYKLDRNTGTFDAAWKALTGANLAAETISALGFRIKVRITATATLATSVITGLGVLTTSTLAAQNAGLYLLDAPAAVATPTATDITLTNLKPNSEVRIFRLSDNVELAAVENSTSTFTYSYTYSSDVEVYIVVLNVQYDYLRLDSVFLNAAGTKIRVLQRYDNIY